ncbi:GNAT family N-acetyltransferase [Alteromonas sp. 5E99-2]|uniref:GNAT family N-acetyltransferase n=1 Tax=Alteromonas sp. 5E99-2 TaxID=2817683 RepID=UPI001A98CEEB|nr:GNAT family N-acetyltransferase [Alteromonas sp. 5E99-2]MBO1256538.1 GNAT family N-acetyltransferase [Alteromonas sp. 5E99-2]
MTQSTLLVRIANATENTIWDTYVDAHIHGTPYHKSAWSNAVTSSYKFVAKRFIAINPSTNQVTGILPLIIMKVPLKGQHLCSLPYCDLGGPLADSPEIAQELINAAFNFAKEEGIASTQIRSVETSPFETDDLEGQKVRMLMSLPPSAETLLASFKSKLRSQIRKAEKNGLVYETGNSAKLLNDFYHVYCVNMRDLGSPAHHKTWFEDIASSYAENVLISVVYHENIPVGAGMVLLNEKTASIPWASTIQAYNRLAPNMLLYWSVLGACADKNIATFDFGRSTFNEGTYKFKKQWGAEPVKLLWQNYHQGKLEKDDDEQAQTGSSLRSHVENIWRKLPLPLTIFLGGRVRKYISL